MSVEWNDTWNTYKVMMYTGIHDTTPSQVSKVCREFRGAGESYFFLVAVVEQYGYYSRLLILNNWFVYFIILHDIYLFISYYHYLVYAVYIQVCIYMVYALQCSNPTLTNNVWRFNIFGPRCPLFRLAHFTKLIYYLLSYEIIQLPLEIIISW